MKRNGSKITSDRLLTRSSVRPQGKVTGLPKFLIPVSRSPKRSAWVTPLAVVEGESDLSMAGTAVSAFDIRKHGESDCAFRGRWEYFGMAEFTAIPDGMLFMREANGGDPWEPCLDGEIFPALHLCFFYG